MRTAFHVLRGALALSVVTALGACASNPKPAAQSPAPSVALQVRNHSSFQLDVYSVPMLGANHVRLGSVPAFGETSLTLTRGERQPDGSLLIEVHPIGTNKTWLSPEVAASRDAAACLDVYSDVSGNLDNSILQPSCVG